MIPIALVRQIQERTAGSCAFSFVKGVRNVERVAFVPEFDVTGGGETFFFFFPLRQEVQHGRLMLGGRGSFQEIYGEFLQSCVEPWS